MSAGLRLALITLFGIDSHPYWCDLAVMIKLRTPKVKITTANPPNSAQTAEVVMEKGTNLAPTAF